MGHVARPRLEVHGAVVSKLISTTQRLPVALWYINPKVIIW